MAGQSRKWMIVVATVWIQAFTGTNFDFSAYSSDLKAAMGISQVELNYLATASDLGKLFGWSSGLALLYLPLPVVLLIAAVAGLVSYSLQWLVVTSNISLPYVAVFLLCLLAGCSICWFNTVCFVLCIRNFPINRSIALSLSISFNGVSAALYSLIASSLSSITTSSSIYLFLNAVVPLIVSLIALLPILRQPPIDLVQLPMNSAQNDTQRFLFLHILAFFTGLYLLLLNSVSTDSSIAIVILAGAIFLLILPFAVPGVIFCREWAQQIIYSSFRLDVPDTPPLQSFILSNDDDLNKPLLAVTTEHKESNGHPALEKTGLCKPKLWFTKFWSKCYDIIIERRRLVVLGEEHSARSLVACPDFWFYYIAYFCGATIGLVYSNNLGQIAESLNLDSDLTMILAVYSACSFFGRLISAVPDFLKGKVNFARTGWLALALVPTPVGLFILAKIGSKEALYAGTALIGLSSGFIFAAAVSVTSELFGANSIGVNHNILITNIPLGSLLYGQIAALVYDSNGTTYGVTRTFSVHDSSMVVCMGRDCYAMTFLIWGSFACLGLLCSIVLFLRTQSAYAETERRRQSMMINFSFLED